ncbi:ABC transporter permease [Jeotgalibacillus aurantiacus]|uniref:ABC transporter permease n=1 Tax=Jeotgalibacillus aurantiacus TaxID=2763266 RepID=UPI001D0A863D|nr:ABC transporter permease [Jeotgalibacillus aurantiacus]
MKNVHDIWKDRLQDYNKELQKYLRYIFNGHLMFVIIFAVGGGGFAYSNWIQTLDSSFPSAIVIAAVLAVAATMSPVYTYLKEADKVYLTPLEGQMKQYFVNALVTSFMFQAYIVVVLLAVAMPLYVQTAGATFGDFFLLLIAVLALKIWNLVMRWTILRYQESFYHYIDTGFRFVLNLAFLWALFAQVPTWVVVAIAAILAGYLIAFRIITVEKTLKWELLIDLETLRLHRFYRFANLFTDVPHLKGQAKRRKWLDPILDRSKYGQSMSYYYLYVRTFLRSDEYFGLWVRLTIIASVIIIGSGVIWIKIGTALLFLYLTGFQLIPMMKKHELKIWPDLYPLSSSMKADAFRKVLVNTLAAQAAVFSVVSIWGGAWLDGLLTAGAAVLFVVAFVSVYLPAQVKKMQVL